MCARLDVKLSGGAFSSKLNNDSFEKFAYA